MSRKTARACRHCRTKFRPDPRNAHHQQYCGKEDCRGASKKASQKRWLQKPENRDYFRGEKHVERVRQWRRKHPGYWKSSAKRPPPGRGGQSGTQDVDNEEVIDARDLVTQEGPLQDLSIPQVIVFVGLISMITGSTLQDDIAAILGRLEDRGRDVLGMDPGSQRERKKDYDHQTPDPAGSDP